MFHQNKRAVKRMLQLENDQKVPEQLEQMVERAEVLLRKMGTKNQEFRWDNLAAMVSIFMEMNGGKLPKVEIVEKVVSEPETGLEAIRNADLSDFLKSEGFPGGGSKQDLIDRIREYGLEEKALSLTTSEG